MNLQLNLINSNDLNIPTFIDSNDLKVENSTILISSLNLEFPFLQIVASYLPRREIVFDFMKINKKCKDCILSLKTNNFIILPNELELFPNIETLNVYGAYYAIQYLTYSIEKYKYIEMLDELVKLKEQDNEQVEQNKYLIQLLKFNTKINTIIYYDYTKITKIKINKDVENIIAQNIKVIDIDEIVENIIDNEIITHKQITISYTFDNISTEYNLSTNEFKNLQSLSIDLAIYADESFGDDCNINFKLPTNLKILIIKAYIYGETENDLYLNISSTSLQYFHSSIYDKHVFINLNTPNLKVIANVNSNINLLNYFNGYLMFDEYYKHHPENKYKGMYSFRSNIVKGSHSLGSLRKSFGLKNKLEGKADLGSSNLNYSDDKMANEYITYDLYFVAVLKREQNKSLKVEYIKSDTTIDESILHIYNHDQIYYKYYDNFNFIY